MYFKSDVLYADLDWILYSVLKIIKTEIKDKIAIHIH